jgi:hypothetical protein
MEHFGHSLIYFGHRLYILDGRLYVLDVRMKVLKGDFSEIYEILSLNHRFLSKAYIELATWAAHRQKKA